MFGSSHLFGSGRGGPFYDHEIDGSMFLDGYNSAYAYRTPIDVDDETKGTWSWWWKRASEDIAAGSTTVGTFFLHNVSNSTNRGLTLGSCRTTLPHGLYFGVNPPSTATANRTFLATNAQFHDQSGWVHVLWVFDSTDDVESNRCKCYINGVRQTSFFEEDYPPQNAPHYFDTGHGQWEFGDVAYAGASATRVRFRGYMTEFHFMDGRTYGPEYFGEFKNGIWIPKQVTGVIYGGGGFYMPFTSDTNDASGNGNHFTPSGITSDDFKKDSPTDNYCVLNPLATGVTGAITLRDGNLRYSGHRSGVRGTFAVSSGKWYWEIKDIATGTSAHISVSVADADHSIPTSFNDKAIVYRGNDGNKIIDTVVSSYGSAFTNGNTVGVALDLENGTVEFFVDNTGQGTIALNSISGVTRWQPQVGSGNTTNLSFFTVNFGQLDFEYTPPAGFLPLKTSNLPDPDIDPKEEEEAQDYFQPLIYTGNGQALQVGDVIKKPADVTTISQSLMFHSSGTQPFLIKTSGGSGWGTTMTCSAWVKNLEPSTDCIILGSNTGTAAFGRFGLDAAGRISFRTRNSSGVDQVRIASEQAFLSGDYWVHCLINVDLSASGSDRVKLWINGVRVTTLASGESTYGTVTAYNGNFATSTQIGRGNTNSTNMFYSEMLLAEMHLIDGTNYDETYFGQFDANGIWIPKAVSGVNYGTYGFYLDFADTSDFGADAAGSNDATAYNFATTDQFADSPTNNLAALSNTDIDPNVVLTEGNLDASISAAGLGSCRATVSVSSGKWFWEATITGTGSRENLGIATVDASITANTGFDAGHFTYIATGEKYNDSNSFNYGATFGSGDVIGVALDLDNGTLKFYKNGNDQGVAFEGLEGTFSPLIGSASTAQTVSYRMNFGQRTLYGTDGSGTLPAGFSLLSENNIPVDEQNLESPDFVWIKNRDQTDSHQIYDTIRGVQKVLKPDPDTNPAEADAPNGLLDFNKNGFTIGQDVTVNTSGENYVAWLWKAGGTPTVDNSAGAGNVPTAGSVKINGSNSQVALAGTIPAKRLTANTESGFSIVNFDASSAGTIAHGLTQAPDFIIEKKVDSTGDWILHTTVVDGTNDYFRFNKTDQGNAATWTAPTSSVFNKSQTSSNNIAYCFHSVEGFSKFGTYIGNGSTNGPFVYTGFRPAFIMVKRQNSTGSFVIVDTARDAVSPLDSALLANDASFTESSGYTIYACVNGFKIKNSGTGQNASGTYVYMAFAGQPFKYANAR